MQPSHKFNLWLALQQILIIIERLVKFGVVVPKTCVFCDIADELFDNLFFECSITKDIWNRQLTWLGKDRRIKS